MRDVAWDRVAAIGEVREGIWRYLAHAPVNEEGVVLAAAALLQMEPHEIRTLARVHFIDSDEVERLLEEMPSLVRQLANTTVADPESSVERVRGAVRWGETYAGRAATGLPHLHVTTPARRAYETPENAVLAFALDAICTVGRQTGWMRARSGVGAKAHARVERAERWLRTRMLSDLAPVQPSSQMLARVRSGRGAERYRAALDVVDLHARYVRRLDPVALREAIENHAIVTSDDSVLLELQCAFLVERTLRQLGWGIEWPGLIGSGPFLTGKLNGSSLELHYQRAPDELVAASIHRTVLTGHSFPHIRNLKPDLSLVLRRDGTTRWLLFEVKGGRKPRVAAYARSALLDLLAYRRAFDPVLSASEPPYGVGIAWGEAMAPAYEQEVVLCTPDTLGDALSGLLGDGASAS
jgi:hypothetical protein